LFIDFSIADPNTGVVIYIPGSATEGGRTEFDDISDGLDSVDIIVQSVDVHFDFSVNFSLQSSIFFLHIFFTLLINFLLSSE
jgi:hypothetical protein